MSVYAKFSAEVSGAKIVLGYQYILQSRKLKVDIADLRGQDKRSRLPAYYQYFETTRDRPYPVMRVIAGPGVGITLDGYPPAGYRPSNAIPDVDIIRVQDPELVPIIGFDNKTHLLLQDYEVNKPDLAFVPSNEPRDASQVLLAPLDFFSVVPLNNGVILRHHFTRQDLIVTVPAHEGDPEFLRDEDALSADAKFVFQINRGGQLGGLRAGRSSRPPILEVVKTPGVHVELARQPKSYSVTNITGSRSALNDIFFQIYETKKISDVPNPGELFSEIRSSWKRADLSKVKVRQPVVVSTSLTIIDTMVRLVPGLSDVIDLIEFSNGAFAGRDLYGRKLATSDLIFLGIGALLPFVASSALRDGSTLRNKFGRKAPEAAKLLQDFHLSKDEARLIREVEDLVKQGGNVPIAKLQDYVGVVRKLKGAEPRIEVLLNVEQTGFIQADLQASYRRYRQDSSNPVGPREWALNRTRDPEALALLKGILGADYAKQARKVPLPRDVNGFEVPRPVDLPDRLADEMLETLFRQPEKLTERLTHVLPDFFIDVNARTLFRLADFSTPKINLGHFNILKGNIAEIFARDIKLRRLTEIRLTHHDAFLIGDIRIQLMEDGKLQPKTLFTDGAIARMNGGNLELLEVYEIKSGYKGGQEATQQIFDWIEGRLTDAEGSRFILAKGGELIYSGGIGVKMVKEKSFLYDPGSRKSGRVIGLNSARRVLVTPKGVSQLGVNSADRVATDVVREELQFTAGQIEQVAGKVMQAGQSKEVFVQMAPIVERMPNISSEQMDYLSAQILGKLAGKFVGAVAQPEATSD